MQGFSIKLYKDFFQLCTCKGMCTCMMGYISKKADEVTWHYLASSEGQTPTNHLPLQNSLKPTDQRHQ